jgi:hypothetical protein
VAAGTGEDASGRKDAGPLHDAGADRVAHGERHANVVADVTQGGDARVERGLRDRRGHQREPILVSERRLVRVERQRDVLVQIDEPRQHEAIAQIDEPRVRAIALRRLVAVLDGGDLAVGDDDRLLAQRLLARIGQQPAGMNHDDSGMRGAAKEHRAHNDDDPHSSPSRNLR